MNNRLKLNRVCGTLAYVVCTRENLKHSSLFCYNSPMTNKEYKRLGIKNYYDISLDGRLKDKINKKMKKQVRRMARRRMKHEEKNMYDRNI